MERTKQNAKQLFYNKEYEKALKIFSKKNKFYEAGLCSLLLKDEINAREFWQKKAKDCPACAWGLCILGYINLKNEKNATFFQTRAFLEVYLSLFLDNELIEWAQNLISCCDILYRTNPEAYKFIARALYANGYFELAITFCQKSLRLFYADPEALLILSQCQYLLKNGPDALDSVNKVLNMVPDYYPAKIFRNILIEEIENENIEKSGN